MASLTLANANTSVGSVELKSLYEQCEHLLPVYARPRFLRIQSQAILTATFKQQKMTLVKEGFNPELCGGEVLYCIDPENKTFKVLDKDLYEKIVSGIVRL